MIEHLSEYEYLWITTHFYCLFKLGPVEYDYTIENINTKMALIIEDDEIYKEVIKKCISEGLTVFYGLPA